MNDPEYLTVTITRFEYNLIKNLPPWERNSTGLDWKIRHVLKRFIDRNPDPQPEPDEPAVTVFVTSEGGATSEEIMASIAKRAEELIGTPEGMAKSLELEPSEKA